MEPAVAAAAIAAPMLGAGALLLHAGRRAPARSGLRAWGAGLLLLGAGHALQLATRTPMAGLLADAVMLGATLLLVAGQRDFAGQAALSRGSGALLLLVALALQLVAAAQFGAAGGQAAAALALAAAQAALAVAAARSLRPAEPPLRPALALLLALSGVLAALSLVQGVPLVGAALGALPTAATQPPLHAAAVLATALLPLALLWLAFEALSGQLDALTTRDALTRVLNRAGLDDALARHFGARNARPLTLLSLDVDQLKRINTGRGRACGDAVLRALAATLVRHLRPSDLVARVGGDEFVVLSAVADTASATALAERLRAAVAAGLRGSVADGSTAEATAAATVSIGISRPIAALTDWPRAAAEAERALVAAQAAGRDRVLAA